MPRDSAGNYSLVAGNPVQSGEVVSSSWANNTLDDVAVALSDSLDRNGRGGMLAPFRFSDGTNLLPGAAWVNETTTGFYRFDGGDLRIAVLTQDVMRWQTSGVQIWNNTDLIWQNVLTDGGGGSQVPVNVGTADGQTLRWEADDSEWQASSALVVDDAGNVGIGTTTPAVKLQVQEGTGAGTDCYMDFQVRSRIGYDGSVVGMRMGTNSAAARSIHFDATAAGASDVVITSPGNVGIGTANPVASLHAQSTGPAAVFMSSTNGGLNEGYGGRIEGEGVSGEGGHLRLGVVDDSSFTWGMEIEQQAATVRFFTGVGNNERMRIDSAGRVGIGTTSPVAPLHVNLYMRFTNGAAASGFDVGMLGGADDDNGYIHNRNAGANIIFGTSDTERMRIGASGNLLLGKTSTSISVLGVVMDPSGNSSFVAPTGTVGCFFVRQEAAAGADVVNFRSNFNGTNTECARLRVDGTLQTASDASLKDSVATLTKGLDTVLSLNPVSFRWINSGENDIGFIAQEVEAVVPEATGRNDADLMTMAKDKLVPVLVKAIQELTARLEALEP